MVGKEGCYDNKTTFWELVYPQILSLRSKVPTQFESLLKTSYQFLNQIIYFAFSSNDENKVVAMATKQILIVGLILK